MTMQHKEHFYRHLAAWLRDPKHSQRAVARDSGVSRSHLAKILKAGGEFNVSLDVAGRIAAAIGMSLSEMIEPCR